MPANIKPWLHWFLQQYVQVNASSVRAQHHFDPDPKFLFREDPYQKFLLGEDSDLKFLFGEDPDPKFLYGEHPDPFH